MKNRFLIMTVAAASALAAQQTVAFATKSTMGNATTITVANKKHHSKKHMKKIAGARMTAPAAKAAPAA